jgi:hypothetical protein
MKGLENTTYAVMLLVSNLAAILFLVSSIKLPRLGRALYGLLFISTGLVNWLTAMNNPEAFLDYRNFSVIQYFHTFVDGWFKQNELLVVASVAILMFLIALGLQLRGIVFKIAAVLGITFLMSPLLLGVGAAFPATVIFAFGVYFLLNPVPGSTIQLNHKKHALQ